MSKLASRIKSLRKEKDLTQEEFGKLFGIVKSTVSLYESGKSTPDDETKKKIADYFGVSLDYLMGASNIKSPSGIVDLPEDEIITMAAHKLGMDPNHKLTDEERQKLKDIFRYVFNDLINNGK